MPACQELPSESDRDPGVFRLEFDIPEEAGKIALLVKPRGGRETVSAILLHREIGRERQAYAGVPLCFSCLKLRSFELLRDSSSILIWPEIELNVLVCREKLPFGHISKWYLITRVVTFYCILLEFKSHSRVPRW